MVRTIFVFVLGFVLMGAAGYYYRGIYESRKPVAGFCCVRTGSECQPMDGVDACRTAGGLMFDTSKQVCSVACDAPSAR